MNSGPQELHISLGELGTAGLVVLAAQVHYRNVNGSCAVVPGDLVGGLLFVAIATKILYGIVKKCAVEENPKSEIDRYQAA